MAEPAPEELPADEVKTVARQVFRDLGAAVQGVVVPTPRGGGAEPPELAPGLGKQEAGQTVGERARANCERKFGTARRREGPGRTLPETAPQEAERQGESTSQLARRARARTEGNAAPASPTAAERHGPGKGSADLKHLHMIFEQGKKAARRPVLEMTGRVAEGSPIATASHVQHAPQRLARHADDQVGPGQTGEHAKRAGRIIEVFQDLAGEPPARRRRARAKSARTDRQRGSSPAGRDQRRGDARSRPRTR